MTKEKAEKLTVYFTEDVKLRKTGVLQLFATEVIVGGLRLYVHAVHNPETGKVLRGKLGLSRNGVWFHTLDDNVTNIPAYVISRVKEFFPGKDGRADVDAFVAALVQQQKDHQKITGKDDAFFVSERRNLLRSLKRRTP